MGKIWLERLLRFSAKIQQFLTGRYARNDQLNQFLLKMMVILWVMYFFFPILLLRLLLLTTISIYFYRFLSKRIYNRLNENQQYLIIRQKIGKKIAALRSKNAQGYRYFVCPNCKQKLRAPKGRGKINVTCNHCNQQFIKKV